MKMTCGDVRERLELLADGALEPPEATAAEEHLAACGACRSYRMVARELDVALRRELQGESRRRNASAPRLAAARRFGVGLAAAVAIVACAAAGAEAYRVRCDAGARTEALRTAERVLESVIARGLAPRDVGVREVEGATVCVSGGPTLYEVRVSVPIDDRGAGALPAAGDPARGRAEIVAIFGQEVEVLP
jgi:hypothetical protein